MGFFYASALAIAFILNLGLMMYLVLQPRSSLRLLLLLQAMNSAAFIAAFYLTAHAPSAEWAFLWGAVRYMFGGFLTYWTFLIVIRYTNRWSQTPWHLFALVVPAITVVVFAVPEWRAVFFLSWEMFPKDGIFFERFRVAGWGLVHMINSAVWLVMGGVMLVIHANAAYGLYKKQVFWYIFAAVVLVAAQLIGTLTMINQMVFNPFPFGVLIFSAMLVYAFRKQPLPDVRLLAYNTVVSNISDLVIALDQNENIAQLNKAAAAWLGGKMSQLIGRPMRDVWPGDWDRTLLSRTTSRTQFINVVNDGDETVFDVRITPLYQDKQWVGRVLVMRDITPQKQAEREREQLIKDLDAYAYSVAHDLKTPLSAIYGYSELLQDMPDLDETARMSSVQIHEASKQMLAIIEAFLFIGNVRRQHSLEVELLPMDKLVQTAIDQLKSQSAKFDAQITVDRPLPTAQGHPAWVLQVLINYISNAIRYGGTPPSIHISAKREGDFVRYEVRDNGHGLTDAEQAKLFNEYVRVNKEVGKGTGLGLSIVKRIVERLGGKCGVESTVGEGSTFYFTLPTPIPTDAPPPDTSATGAPAAPSAPAIAPAIAPAVRAEADTSTSAHGHALDMTTTTTTAIIRAEVTTTTTPIVVQDADTDSSTTTQA
jgi:PAS domain S-box-containing protein